MNTYSQSVANFICGHCRHEVYTSGNIGTHQRNHCPFCLYSRHVDEATGDRKSTCQGMMAPIGLTFKKETDEKKGEIMLIHKCNICGKISINRLAGDDDVEQVQAIFRDSQQISNQLLEALKSQDVVLANEDDSKEISIQLFGK